MQYFKPTGDFFVGDCMPFWHDGVFHLYWLLDEQHHQALGGLGGHQWAHSSTRDLAHWEQHPLALGNPHIRTPNIDRLVADGVAFTHAYRQSPICTPSRASFLTGQYASTVHACMNGNDTWAEAAPLVTKLLKDVGYGCGLAGKLHLAGAAYRIEPRPQDDGYRVFHWSHDPNDRWPTGHAYADWVHSQGYKLAELHKSPDGIPAHLHQTTWCADRAIGELFDLDADPWEFDNLWDDPAHAATRFDLLKASFDALAFAVDLGPKQVVAF